MSQKKLKLPTTSLLFCHSSSTLLSFGILLPSPTSASSKLFNAGHSDYQRESSVASMIEDLGWEQLHTHRQQAKATMLLRIVNQLIDIQATSLLILMGTLPREYVNRLFEPFCIANASKCSVATASTHRSSIDQSNVIHLILSHSRK